MKGEGYVAREEPGGGIQLWGLIQTIRMHLAPRCESLYGSSHFRHELMSAQPLVWARVGTAPSLFLAAPTRPNTGQNNWTPIDIQ